jgi:hypothetical protein
MLTGAIAKYPVCPMLPPVRFGKAARYLLTDLTVAPVEELRRTMQERRDPPVGLNCLLIDVQGVPSSVQDFLMCGLSTLSTHISHQQTLCVNTIIPSVAKTIASIQTEDLGYWLAVGSMMQGFTAETVRNYKQLTQEGTLKPLQAIRVLTTGFIPSFKP